MIFDISAARLRQALTILVVTLTTLSFAGALSSFFLHMRFGGLVRVFDVNAEDSIPNWYSAVALAVSAALLAAIAATLRARKQPRDLASWTALAGLFILLSLDEIAGLHEGIGGHIHGISREGWFHHVWVVPALVMLPIVGGTFIPFLSRMAARRRNQIVLAGLIFVGGAVVMESVGGKIFAAAGKQLTLNYIISFHIEEFMEMFGIVLFNAALIEELAELLGPDGLRLRFTKD